MHNGLRGWSFVGIGIMSVAVLCVGSTVGRAQQPRLEQRQAAVDGIMRNLLDTNMGWYDTPKTSVIPPGAADPKATQMRQTLSAFSNDCNTLVNTLRVEAQYAYEPRLLLVDAMSVYASANALVQRSQYLTSVDQIANDVSALDGQWRVLSHRLRQSRTLGLAVGQQVDRLDAHSQQMATLLQRDPLMQTDELQKALADLDAEMTHLISDVRIDLVNLPIQRQLDAELQQVVRSIRNLRRLADAQRSFAEVQNQYKALNGQWTPTKAKLRKIDNRHLQRSVTRTNEVNDYIRELLLLERVIDGNDVLYMATVLKQDVDAIGDQVSLRRLIELPNATDVFNRMREFYALAGDFRQSVETKTRLDELLFDFRVLEVAWLDLRETLGPFKSEDTMQHAAQVEAAIADLRIALGIETQESNDESLQLAATLSNLSELLHFDMTRFVSRGTQYDAQFRTAATNATGQLRSSTRTLQDALAANTADPQIRQQCQDVASKWNQLQPYVARVKAADRSELIETCQQIAPLVAKLQVLYAY